MERVIITNLQFWVDSGIIALGPNTRESTLANNCNVFNLISSCVMKTSEHALTIN